MSIWRYSFWKDAAERAVKTTAQVLLVFLGADLVDAFAVDYRRAAGIAVGAAVVSVLTSLASTQVSAKGTASLVPEANAPVQHAPAGPGDDTGHIDLPLVLVCAAVAIVVLVIAVLLGLT